MTLLSRVEALEDLNAIKRLQYRYAYRLVAGDWAGTAELFVPNGTLEVGLDGVFRGRAGIAQYMSEVWGPAEAPGVIRAHLQIMPVITLAPDGRSARATWREIGTGGGGGIEAYWAEGPMENRYEKVGDSWLIASVNWRRGLHVPFRGGWGAHRDQAPKVLTAGEAATNTYEVWPGTGALDYHFEDPELAAQPDHTDARECDTADAAALEVLPARIAELEAVRALENLQALLGYSFDKALWDPLCSLLTPDCTVDFNGSVVRGRMAIRAVLEQIAPQGPEYGRLQDVMQLQPIITVGADSQTATGTWRLFGQFARHEVYHELALAIADITYARGSGGWQVSGISISDVHVTPYDQGWDRELLDAPTLALGVVGPSSSDDLAADEAGAAAATPDLAALTPTTTSTEDLALRLSRLEAAQGVERVQNIYGYYLSTLKWDQMIELFDEDGTMEVALRGVYRGRQSIRQCLDLFGTTAEWGVLHNHMQLQPMIEVSADGSSARLRSRSFSMMGAYDGITRWMGGLYENELVRRDGRWVFAKDQVFNTYFATYEDGWKHLTPRRPPLVSPASPPDEPPTVDFDMFPYPFLPPFSFDGLKDFNLY